MAEFDKKELLKASFGEDHPAVVFGTFHGFEKEPEELEAEYIAAIKKGLRGRESALFAKKWFDYRFLNPVTATWLFAHEYTQAYRQYFVRVRLSAKDAEWRLPVAKLDAIFHTRHATGFVTARQWADEMGVPYDFYLSRIMYYTQVREWERHPMPAQLYAEDMLEYVWEKWTERQAEFTRRAIHPAFKAGRYQPGNPHQEAYYDYLCNAISKKPHSKYMLADALARGDLPSSYASRRFDSTLLESAAELQRTLSLYKPADAQ